MNMWDFAASNPKVAAAVGITTVVCLAGAGIAYACNKTPVIGTFSPTVNLNVGGGEGMKNEDQLKLDSDEQKQALSPADVQVQKRVQS